MLAIACGPTKDNFFNRRYQNLLARDNAYFNARLKLADAVKTLAAANVDDHTRVIDVYPYGTEKDGKTLLPAMDEVYKKCSNVIQKRPISKWIDDCYMVIGQSHFFKRDYFAALETFQFVGSKYKIKNPVISKEAEIWIVKCYLYLDKLGEAEAVMSGLLAEKNTPKELLGFLHATAAAVYIKQEKYTTALEQMKLAVPLTKGREKKIRYNYILGQLYERAGKSTLAIFHYKRVIKRTPPYEFEFNSKLSIARLYNPKDKNASKQVRRYFKRLLNDDKNIDYFDQVYYELGNIEYREKNIPPAVKDYTYSILFSKTNVKQKSLSYYALAKLYFAQPEYTLAQAYYDSLGNVMPPDFPDSKKINAMRLVLGELIKNLTIIQTEDSLQLLAKLSPEELEKKVKQWQEAEKQQAAQAEKAKKEREKQGILTPPPPANNLAASGGIGSWYFYNPVSMNQGKTDFARKWGERKLEDYWRLSAKEKELELAGNSSDSDTTQSDSDSSSSNKEEVKKEVDPLEKLSADKKKLYDNLPVGSKALKASNEKIAEAMYNLGIIYKEKLNDDKEAIKVFELLLKRFPGSTYEPEVYYRLYKIHKETGNKKETEKYKNLLLEKYPASDYALLITDKYNAKRDNAADKQLKDYYEVTYNFYKEHNCAEVTKRIAESDRLFPGSVLKPKFDYLGVLCVARDIPVDSFKISLNGIISTYPGHDVAKNAKELLEIMTAINQRRIQDSIKALAPKDTLQNKNSKSFEFSGAEEKHFYAVVLPIKSVPIGDLKVKVADYNTEFHELERLQISALILDDRNQIFVVKEFPNDKKAMSYLKEFEETNKIFQIMGVTEYKHFIISSANFVKLLRTKNLEEYLDSYQQKFK